ncbi:hypothetical protein N2W54_008211 [Lotmaria passim]
MPAEDKSSVQPLTRSLSDSVDLADFPAANRLRSPGWLDAVNRVQPVPGQSPSATASTNAPNDSTALLITQGGGSTLGERTPTTSRRPAEVTAMSSPIPVDTDDSDANINQLISRLGRHGEPKLGGLRTRVAEKNASAGERAATGPALRHRAATPPPSPKPAGAAPQAASPPAPRPVTSANVPNPTSRSTAVTVATAGSSSSSLVQRYQHGTISPAYASSSHLSGSVTGSQNSPFGGNHNVRASADQTATQLLRQSNMHDQTTLTDDTSPPFTSYSSALMQALSRTEGAAVVTSQWTSSTHPSRTYATTRDAEEGDDDASSAGSSAYPPDIYEEAMRAKVAKQQWMALERARQEVLAEARRRRDCPFAPQVSPYAARLRRPASLRPENRVQSEIIRRKQWLAKKQQQEVERELRECTFRPLTVRAARLDPTALAPRGPAVFHNLYAEAEERRAFEAEVKPQVVQQAERRLQVSPMRPEQLSAVVERLCARGVVRTADTVTRAKREGKDDAGEGGHGEEEGGMGVEEGLDVMQPYATAGFPEGGAGVGAAASNTVRAPSYQPLLSAESQRIVAAQVAAGERDPDIVRHLYRQAERDAMKGRLRLEFNAEKEKIARAEQARVLAQDRRRLQQDYYRAVLAAKYRALSRYVCDTQHTSYRATAPQSIALLARASFDLLSTEETEELLGAVEHCGQRKLREAEFVAVVFRHFAEQRVTPADTALLTRPPPAAANAKRAGSNPRVGCGGSGSVDGSPLNFPRIKREKPDPEVIAHIRESRALALEEWKKERQRRCAITEGIVADEDYPFQPAPRRLIPYECRPDVVVPVKMTKSEALRRAYIASRQQERADSPIAVAAKANTNASTVGTEHASTARELFSRLATSEGLGSGRNFSSGAQSRAHSRSGAATATAASSTMQRERSAAVSSASPAPRPHSRAASVGAREPSRSPPQPSTVKSTTAAAAAAMGKTNAMVASNSNRARTPLLSNVADAQPRWPPAQQQQQQQQPRQQGALSPSPAAHSNTASPLTDGKPTQTTGRARSSVPAAAAPASLVEQIMQSTPEDRARLGRELLLRQLRDRQRRQGTQRQP